MHMILASVPPMSTPITAGEVLFRIIFMFLNRKNELTLEAAENWSLLARSSACVWLSHFGNLYPVKMIPTLSDGSVILSRQ